MESRITELAKKFYELKAKNDELKKQLELVDIEWSGVEAELLEHMVEEGISSVKVDGLGKFTLAAEHYFSVTADKKPMLYDHIKQMGHGAIIREDVPANTLKAFCKQLLSEKINLAMLEGKDAITSEQESVEEMKSLGLSYFKKRTIRTQKA